MPRWLLLEGKNALKAIQSILFAIIFRRMFTDHLGYLTMKSSIYYTVFMIH
jgi:hypothetical protein